MPQGRTQSKKRLTNLLQLTVDTSWWTRYRDDAHNPDLDGFGSFLFLNNLIMPSNALYQPEPAALFGHSPGFDVDGHLWRRSGG